MAEYASEIRLIENHYPDAMLISQHQAANGHLGPSRILPDLRQFRQQHDWVFSLGLELGIEGDEAGRNMIAVLIRAARVLGGGNVEMLPGYLLGSLSPLQDLLLAAVLLY